MDNKSIASVLYETADLMEVDGGDPFRIRSYRRAAESIDGLAEPVESLIHEPKKLLEVPGIGKGMLANLQEIATHGKLRTHADLLQKYRPSMLELLKIGGLGPKTIALIWSAYHVCDPEGIEQLARDGQIRKLPRMGEKQEQKILKAVQDYRRISGRFCLDEADRTAQKLTSHISSFEGIDNVTPAGSLRRGRETIGDLDLLVTGPACLEPSSRQQMIEHVLRAPGIVDVLAKGDNKTSFKLRSGMQVDVRLLPPESFGAGLQYFTGSKSHNVKLRQRALKMGLTLNEYELAELEGGKRVAAATEQAIYSALNLDYIPPELREDCGEIEAAAGHSLPDLITQADLRGDVHMHTVETDGRCTIEEMAVAARERGYEYIAITDHTKNLAFANGLDDKRAVQHIERIRKAAESIEGIHIFAGVEVDVLADGSLDLSDDVLAQMDVVIASVHSYFSQEAPQMTERLLRAIQNPNVSIIGHPTGRILLKREGYSFDIDAVLKAAAGHHAAMELNAYPDRLDLCDRNLRMAKVSGVRIVINTDSHHTSHLEKMRYGILQARRAWLTRKDVLNTLPAEQFALAMKRKRS